jgi:peptidoglycan/LPS O-acetylase OafA/YrhL
VYLLFPLLVRLLRATERYHLWVLAASGVLQLAIQWQIVHPPALDGVAATMFDHVFLVVFAYQFYVVLGAVAAMHIDLINEIVRRFGVVFVGGAVAAAVYSEWDYYRSINLGLPPEAANNLFMLHLLPFYVLLIAALYTVSQWWAARQGPGSVSARWMKTGSDRSFAVFLLHPFALQLVAPWIVSWITAMGRIWGTTVLYLCVMAMSLVFAEIVRRAPGSMWTTGRPMIKTDLSGLFRRVSAE